MFLGATNLLILQLEAEHTFLVSCSQTLERESTTRDYPNLAAAYACNYTSNCRSTYEAGIAVSPLLITHFIEKKNKAVAFYMKIESV